jgi:hypothetical protein
VSVSPASKSSIHIEQTVHVVAYVEFIVVAGATDGEESDIRDDDGNSVDAGAALSGTVCEADVILPCIAWDSCASRACSRSAATGAMADEALSMLQVAPSLTGSSIWGSLASLISPFSLSDFLPFCS